MLSFHRGLWVAFALYGVCGCGRSGESPPAPSNAAPATAVSGPATEGKPKGAVVAARIGQPAPDFTLPDLDGRPVKLSEHLGKVTVLEWFNPECPFVKAAHTKGSLKTFAKEQADKGVVWLAVNSGAPGKQGHGAEANLAGKERFGLSHPVLFDESGKVGRAYGAERTPHLFVVDAKGVLVYAGAIDNSPDGEGESPAGGQLVNYVGQTLEDVRAGRPVRTPETKAYGCSVKYGS